MLALAKSYAMAFPELEWLYIGKHCMEVSRGKRSQGGSTDVFALSEERDECLTYLQEMFGGEAT